MASLRKKLGFPRTVKLFFQRSTWGSLVCLCFGEGPLSFCSFSVLSPLGLSSTVLVCFELKDFPGCCMFRVKIRKMAEHDGATLHSQRLGAGGKGNGVGNLKSS